MNVYCIGIIDDPVKLKINNYILIHLKSMWKLYTHFINTNANNSLVIKLVALGKFMSWMCENNYD